MTDIRLGAGCAGKEGTHKPETMLQPASPAGHRRARRPWRQLRVHLLLVARREEREGRHPTQLFGASSHWIISTDLPVSLALWSNAKGKQGDICSRQLQRVFSGV